MSKHSTVSVALISSVLALLLQGAAAPPKQLGEIVGDDVYTNCEYRVAAQFPNEPKFRDITYRDGTRTAPARQFYFDRPIGPLSVTVVHFADGAAVDKQAISNAAETLRRRGEPRFDFPVYYDDAISAQIPGRQLQIALKDGHFLNGSVYTLMVTQIHINTYGVSTILFHFGNNCFCVLIVAEIADRYFYIPFFT